MELFRICSFLWYAVPSKVLSRVMNSSSSSSSHNITYSKDEIFEEGKGCDYFKTVVFQYDIMVW